MDNKKKRLIIFILVLIIGTIAGIFGYSNTKITTFGECEKAGWLVRSITIYDYVEYTPNAIEKKCTLWTGKSFEKKLEKSESDTNITSVPEISYSTNEWKTWEDNYYSKTTGESFSYKLQYPRDFDVFRGDNASGGLNGNPAVRLAFPDDAFQTPGTNYAGAHLVISIGTDKLSLDNCYKKPAHMVLANPKFSDTQLINGRMFYTDTFRDHAAGSVYDSKIYRILIDNRCFEAVQTIHTGNIDNYPAGTATEFDQSKAMSILNQMLETLTITTSTTNP